MEMVLLISILSLIFIGIGTLITEKNAAYLLSGYNTMSKEKQEQVDLKRTFAFFKEVSHQLRGFACCYWFFSLLFRV